MPFPINIQLYLDENILTQEQAETLSNLEREALNTEFAREKLLNGVEKVAIYSSSRSDSEVEITQIFRGNEAACLFLECPTQERANGMQLFIGVQVAIDEKILTIEQAISMPMKKIFLVSSPLFRALIASGEASFDAESGLVIIQEHPLTEMEDLFGLFAQLRDLQTYIEQSACPQKLTQNITFLSILSFARYKQLFTQGILTLDEVLALNQDQWKSLGRLDDFVTDSLGGRAMMGGSEARIISGILERAKQIPGRIHDMVKKHIISKEDMLNFPNIKHSSPPLCSLIVNGKISLTQAQSFTAKQKIYLSGHNAHDLILAGIVTIKQIFRLTGDQLGQLERLNLREAKADDVFHLARNSIAFVPGQNLNFREFITLKKAPLTLHVIVQEEAVQHINSSYNPQTSQGFMFLNQKMIDMEATHITDEVWNKIKERVSTRMWDTFHFLFSSQNDPNFIELIEAGQTIKLNRSSEIQSLLAGSEGYRQYCSHTLFNSRFFQHPKWVEEKNTDAEVVEENASYGDKPLVGHS